MKINVNTVLTDVTGQPLKVGTPEKAEDMTIAHVIIQLAMMAPPQGANSKPYTPEEQVQRWHLGIDTQKARETEPHELQLNAKVVAQLREDIAKNYGPVVAGQLIDMLDK